MSFLRRRYATKGRGQALVEFAIILPLLVLLLVMAIDLGRVFFGWVALQNAARIGAAYAAAHPSGWQAPGDPDIVAAYEAAIENDLTTINCAPDAVPAPVPTDTDGDGMWDDGEPVTVTLGCEFSLMTPLASNIVGGTLDLTASSEFYTNRTIQAGIPTPPPPPPTPTPVPTPIPSPTPTPVGPTPTPGGPTPTPCPPPVANFTASPTSGKKPLDVQFTDTSTTTPGCAITAWQWTFGDSSTSSAQHPTHRYNPPGSNTVTFTVSLTVTTSGGSNTRTVPAMITVTK